MRITSEGERGGSGRRIIGPLIIIAIILYVTLFFALRTEGGKSIVVKWLSERTGITLEAERTALGFPFALVYKYVKNVSVEDGYEISADEIRISPACPLKIKVVVKRGDLVLVRKAGGDWAPSFFNIIGEAPFGSVADFSSALAFLRKRYLIEIRDVSFKWRENTGAELADANGVIFSARSLSIPERQSFFYRLSARSYAVPGLDGIQTGKISREWIAVEQNNYIEVFREGATEGSAGIFWEGGQ